MTKRESVIGRRVADYRKYLSWLIKDMFRFFGKRIGMAATASLLGSVGFVAAFGIVFLYVKSLETGAPMKFLGLEMHIQILSLESALLLGAVGVLLAATALIEYWGGRLANDMLYLYPAHWGKRVTSLASRLSRASPPAAVAPPSADSVVLMTLSDAQLLGVVSRLISVGVFNITSLPVVAAVMLYLAPYLALSVMLVGASGMVAFYKISLRGAGTRQRMVRLMRGARAERRAFVKNVMTRPGVLGMDDASLKAAFEEGNNLAFGQARADQKSILNASKLASKLLVITSLLVLLGIAAVLVADGSTTWANVLVFLFVLQFGSSKLMAAARVIVGVNRFYPVVRRNVEYVQNAEASLLAAEQQSKAREQAHGYEIHTDDEQILPLETGRVHALLLPRALSADQIRGFQSAIRARDDEGGTLDGTPRFHLASAPANRSPATLQEYFGFSRSAREEEVFEALCRFELPQDLSRRLSELLCKPLQGRTLRRVNGLASLYLSAVAAQQAGAAILAIELGLLGEIDEADARAFLARAGERFPVLVLCFSADQDFEWPGIETFFVSDGQRVLTACDISSLPAQRNRLRALQGKSKAAETIDEDLLDEELM